MTIKTIMIHVDIDKDNGPLFEFTKDIATKFAARVICITASSPLQVSNYGETELLVQVFDENRMATEQKINLAKQRFCAAFRDHVNDIGWRSTVTYSSVAEYIAREARAADLIIADPENFNETIDPVLRLSVGDFVMRIGRPVLLSSPRQQKLHLDHVLVGWKDNAESQRAVAAALPLLQQASLVTVAEVVPSTDLDGAKERLEDVTLYLKNHGVTAKPRVVWLESDAVTQLRSVARDLQAGLVVGGAYGHSRLREWVFGGVTKELLLRPVEYCTLLAH